MKIKVEIESPRVPNYLRIKNSHKNATVSIGELTNEELKAVGKQYIDCLIKRAEEIRKNKEGT